MKNRDVLAVFNRGRVSVQAMARPDVARVSLSADTQTNWMPRALGPMSLRPGLAYKGTVAGDGALIPFVYDNDDTAILELSASVLRIWDEGTTLVTRNGVSTTITNGSFTSDLGSWTDNDEGSAASTWATGGRMQLLGTGSSAAKRTQSISVSVGDQNVEHGLRIEINRGPVVLRIGTTSGGDDVFRQAVLRTGTHSIAFTPGAATIYVEFSSTLTYPVLVDSVAIEPSGTLSLATPWSTAALCKKVRWQRSRDVVFCACEGLQQRRIERRPNNSWSVVLYEANDGPFLTENTDLTTITPSALGGEVTLTASRDLWQSGHVGSIWRLSSQGQVVEADVSTANTFTNEVRVTGVGTSRNVTLTIAGTWNATVSLQRSVGEPGNWVTINTYTTNQAGITYNDALDNSEVYYRLGIETGNYTSGTAELNLTYASGFINGVARITAFSSSTSVTAVVLEEFGGTAATNVWAEGSWSDVNGWPTAVAITEGRLFWSGQGRNWGSVSDAFDSFDPDFEGDAGPINRDIGTNATNRTNWLLPLDHLISGTDDAEHSVRSTSFDEVLTQLNYNSKPCSNKGSSGVPAAYVDKRGYFVGRNSTALYELEFSAQVTDYIASRATVLVPEIGASGFSRIAVQVEPDVRLHLPRGDGTVAVMVRDPAEDVTAWIDITSAGASGEIEDVCVLPGTTDDRVFYRVKRTVNGSTVRYLEEMAAEADCIGGTVNKQADSFITGSGSTSTLIGSDHLAGEEVVVWADGRDIGNFTVSLGGEVDLGETVTDWVAGLEYVADYKSAKLAGQTDLGLSLTQRSIINKIGLILANTHYQGVQFGPDFSTLDDLPLVDDGTDTAADTVWEAYDEDMIEFPGDWDTDNRVCLRARAPRPCTVMAAVINIDRQNAA